jgi:hypothetical protein
VMIMDSCILENKATYIFYQSSSYTFTLSKCTVDTTSNNGYLTAQNTVTKSFILALYHMSTQNCYAEFNYKGMQIVLIQPSFPSMEEKHCYTWKKFFHQPRLRDVISLTSILVFNFIYPYTFGDILYILKP